jgi:hypothetical protein
MMRSMTERITFFSSGSSHLTPQIATWDLHRVRLPDPQITAYIRADAERDVSLPTALAATASFVVADLLRGARFAKPTRP